MTKDAEEGDGMGGVRLPDPMALFGGANASVEEGATSAIGSTVSEDEVLTRTVKPTVSIHNTMRCNAMQCNAMQCNTYNTIQYNTIQYNTIQYNTIQYNTIQYNTIHYIIFTKGTRESKQSRNVC